MREFAIVIFRKGLVKYDIRTDTILNDISSTLLVFAFLVIGAGAATFSMALKIQKINEQIRKQKRLA